MNLNALSTKTRIGNCLYAIGTSLLVAFVLVLPKPLYAQTEEPLRIHFFSVEGCSHCEDERAFLEAVESEFDVRVIEYSLDSREHIQLLRQTGEQLHKDVSTVPFTVIGDHAIQGFDTYETTGEFLLNTIRACTTAPCPDVVGMIEARAMGDLDKKPTQANLPVLGDVAINNVSLPMITVVLAAIDGFNPCAMWILLFLISLLLHMRDRAKMWLFGGAFILASGLSYFVFMAAWLNILLFIGFLFWVRALVGGIAIAFGAQHIITYARTRPGTCSVSKGERASIIMKRMTILLTQKPTLFALGGIVLLAFSVNALELACSAGIPAAYTQLLTLAVLPPWQYYGYLLLYIVIFMLDDLIIFAIAMITLRATGLTTKYARATTLVGGILLLLIGFWLILQSQI